MAEVLKEYQFYSSNSNWSDWSHGGVCLIWTCLISPKVSYLENNKVPEQQNILETKTLVEFANQWNANAFESLEILAILGGGRSGTHLYITIIKMHHLGYTGL